MKDAQKTLEVAQMNPNASDPKVSSSADETSQEEAHLGILSSHDITLDVPGQTELSRSPIIQPLSSPTYHSPLRHHRRTPSQHRQVKETLNARSAYTNSEENGKAEHHINQYIIKDEIGRGSFGAVHLAVDQYGTEYAVKEFSKSRLRKRAQSNILRRPHSQRRRPGHLAAGLGLNAPLHRHSASDIHNDQEQGNSLYLIKEEIAIMKKLNHPNLVSLIEVLDDPEEDSLYMVLEMCKKGVVMKVGLNERADPYDAESCRCWFRDLILGIEYLHAQGVVHRDIKPDNLLLTEDDVLKIVDFGVSEMFEKQSEMMTAKSAGSPAFLPPELCVTKHGDISGKAADIWSMGVSLYCLRFGRIPFERSGVLELYEAIKTEEPDINPDHEPEFCDLIKRLLEKDPKKRIKMHELREHPWVTKKGSDPLLSAEENTADLVEPPSEIEVNHAITAKMRNLLVMMKAVQKFKNQRDKKRPYGISEALGKGIRSLHPLSSSGSGLDGTLPPPLPKTRSYDIHDRRLVESALATEGVRHDIGNVNAEHNPLANKMNSSMVTGAESLVAPAPRSSNKTSPGAEIQRSESGEKGHAHDPLDEEPLFLGIGRGENDADGSTGEAVAESPTAAEFNIYDKAYQEEVERIRAAQGQSATVYLTRRVDSKKEYKADKNMVEAPVANQIQDSLPHQGFMGFLDKAREKTVIDDSEMKDRAQASSNKFSDIAVRAMENTKLLGKEVGDKGPGGVMSGLFQKAVGGKWDSTGEVDKKN